MTAADIPAGHLPAKALTKLQMNLQQGWYAVYISFLFLIRLQQLPEHYDFRLDEKEELSLKKNFLILLAKQHIHQGQNEKAMSGSL